MTLGMSIRNRRRDMHLTQKELASRLGISVSAMCLMEMDKRVPSWAVVVSLIRIFGIGVIADAVVDKKIRR